MPWCPGIPISPLPHRRCPSDCLRPTAGLFHRTIGHWPGDYSVLSAGRVPSVHVLVGQDRGQSVQWYPSEVSVAGAAGANDYAYQVEFSGQNGEPLTAWQLEVGALFVRFCLSLGIPLNWLPADGRRVFSWSGFLNHANVATTPQYTHYNYIATEEFQRMAGGAPAPVPEKPPGPPRALLEAGGDKMVTFMIAGRVLFFMPVDDGSLRMFLLAGTPQALYEYVICGPGSPAPDATVDLEYPGGEWHSIPDGFGASVGFRHSNKGQLINVRINGAGNAAGVFVNNQPVNIVRF